MENYSKATIQTLMQRKISVELWHQREKVY